MIRSVVGAALGLTCTTDALSQDYPDYRRESFYVPAADGTRLAVNVYRPATGDMVESRPLPVIFAATPYRARYRDENGKVVELALGDRLALRSLIRAGYVVATADVRGKGASFGTRRGFQDRTEARDSHDLIQWLSRQPYATGKVGMVGCSYLGGTTFQAAASAPSALKAVFIGASDIDKYAFVRRGGIAAQFNTRPDEPASYDLASVPVDADPKGEQLAQAVAGHAANTPMAGLWYSMPYRDSVSSLTGNAFWQEVALYDRLDAMRNAGIATYFWGNWHDEPTAQSIQSAASLGGRFLGGPGDHCNPPPGFDFTGEIRRYFDFHLKGEANGLEQQPRATYWAEGKGWVRSQALPGEQSHPVTWYLSPGDVSMKGRGHLAPMPGRAAHDSFAVDYELGDSAYFAFWVDPMDAHGPSYSSAPLGQPMTLVGFPRVQLTVSSSTPDANVFVYLDEIDAQGKAQVISFGRLALSSRKLSPAPYDTLGMPWHSGLAADAAPVKPGRKVALDIALTPVSRVVPAGHSLRVTVTGADLRQRNLGEIRQDPAPVLTVWQGGADASRIDLPVLD
ncbi:CocE/NonD family hydrolase [Novosphingobium sp. PP1Y]|uniref:CocE/NonD family hydrolase n=1 Tax=Novosphingobium sp. PP1Y TaxID=702113 RepID=UPI00020EFDF4|nr:CocE/NonD family hydrolase [Novosphingobium sp. PP1Y]CCA90968.1 peptidase S15 [Novosphingobium sp. PP1Y]